MEAFQVCTQGLHINPHDRRMDEWLAEILRRSDQLNLSAWLQDKTFAQTDRQYLLARFLWQAGQRQKALAMIASLDPDQVKLGIARYRTALWCTILGKRAQALALLEPEVVRHPADPRALALAARLLAPPFGNADDSQRAYSLLERAVRFGEAVPAVTRTAVDMYIAGGDNARADQISSRALSRNSKDPRLWVTRVICLKRMGKKVEATATLNRALRLFPQDPGLRKLQGRH